MAFTAAAGAVATLSAQVQREIYTFPHDETPQQVKTYSTTLYVNGEHNVSTLKGDHLLEAGKDTIKSFEISPTGQMLAVVVKGKKKSQAALYPTFDTENRIAKFDNGKYGRPVMVAFTTDGRRLALATDTAVYLTDLKKMIPQTRLEGKTPVPEMMVMSPNGYFLAMVNGDKCYIYNMETLKLRKVIDAGESINDVEFSPDNSDVAILTNDGVLSLYNTRNFELGKMIDELGDGIAMSYNLDGKYMAVADSPETILVVNLLSPSGRDVITPETAGLTDMSFLADSYDNTLLAYALDRKMELRRMPGLKPYYNRLINEEVNRKMDEWLKMMPGETMEQYSARVSEEARARQRSMFEYEITTAMAGNLLSGAKLSLGAYDRANSVLALNFDSMPTIFIPVPEDEVTAFSNAENVRLDDVLFGVLPDDSFEIVYAKVTNGNNGKTYLFDNRERAVMNYLKSGDAISLEVLQQQQMEELRLKELREKVMMEAKSANIISDHTNISVNSRLVPDYDADGNKILNYVVTFTYDVSPGFSAQEDFGPGKYHVEESGAASSMLKIVKEAFEGDMRQYLADSRKLKVTLVGTADATPIINGLHYDGSYGTYEDEPVYVDGQMTAISIDPKNLIKENPQLAFLRALGVKEFLEKNVEGYDKADRDYRYEVNVSKDKGSEFRRITADFTFVDAFRQ